MTHLAISAQQHVLVLSLKLRRSRAAAEKRGEPSRASFGLRCTAPGPNIGPGPSRGRAYLVQLSRWLSSMQRSSPKRRLGACGGRGTAMRLLRRCPCCCSSAAATAARVSRRGGRASRCAPAAPRRRSGGGAAAAKASSNPAASRPSAASGGDADARKPKPAASAKLRRFGGGSSASSANAASMESGWMYMCLYRRTYLTAAPQTLRPACTWRAS